jgi:mRNA interferase MazF
MNEAQVALASLPQADGAKKTRPVLLLRQLPRFGDFLACGVSTQIHQEVAGFDDVIHPSDEDFSSSGLISTSIFRLGFLAVLPSQRVLGSIGRISTARHRRLLERLAGYLVIKSGG